MSQEKYRSHGSEPDLEPVALKDVLEKALGPKYCGLRVKMFIYFGLHFVIIAGLLCTDTFLLIAFREFLSFSGSGLIYTIWLIIVLVFHTANYLKLYGSDPGWIALEFENIDPREKCRYCGARIAPRIRHDFNTGQCVHKFDHFCWMLGTAIGNRNNFRFWLFNFVQTYLVLWGLTLVFHRLYYCHRTLDQTSCWKEESWHMVGLIHMAFLLWIALSVFGGLFLFHTYLAATNQTTYEVSKGEKVPYLQASYASYDGPKSVNINGVGLWKFILRVLKGTGPPRPFSSKKGPWNGMGEDLNHFFFEKRTLQSRSGPDDHLQEI